MHIQEYLRLYRNIIEKLFDNDFAAFFGFFYEATCHSLTIFNVGLSTIFDLDIFDKITVFETVFLLLVKERSEEMIFGFISIRNLLKRMEKTSDLEELEAFWTIIQKEKKNFEDKFWTQKMLDCLME